MAFQLMKSFIGMLYFGTVGENLYLKIYNYTYSSSLFRKWIDVDVTALIFM